MAVDARCASPADGPASDGLCARKRSPPDAARCGHCARGKRTRNVLRPMGPARNPVAASKHLARSELRSRRKLLRNLREFHSTTDVNEHCVLRVDTCLKDPLYYGNEICRRTSNFDFLGCFRSREGRTGGTQSRRESHAAAGSIGPKLRVSKNQALFHE